MGSLALARISFPHSRPVSKVACLRYGFEGKWQIGLGLRALSLKDFTEDTVAFIRQLDAPAVLIGHSLGGRDSAHGGRALSGKGESPHY